MAGGSGSRSMVGVEERRVGFRPGRFWSGMWAVWCGWMLVGMLQGVGQTLPARRLPGGVVPPPTARSLSGQFVVTGGQVPEARVGIIPELSANSEMLKLQPQWLAVAAERVKRAVLIRFDSADRWRGKIHIEIKTGRDLRQLPVRIVPVLMPAGWSYRMDVPEEVEWKRLVRALVEVVLLEAANREAGDRVGLPPLWLNEGMTGLVLAEHGRDLVIEGHTAVLRNERRPGALAEVRRVLEGRPPLSFGDLSFPSDTLANDPAAWMQYQASASLLVHELMLDGEGVAAMGRFLQGMPRYLNWQTVFVEAYGNRFLSLLEVEKWWAVNASHVLSRDPAMIWSRDVALTHLRGLMTENATIRADGRADQRQVVSLAEVVLKWDAAIQREVLNRKREQLRELYRHAPSDLLPLVTELNQVLSEYLEDRYRLESDGLRRAELEPRARVVAGKAARRLKILDDRLKKVDSGPDVR